MAVKEIVMAAVTALFGEYDVDAARELLAPDYIQHNPNVPTGAEAILGIVPALQEMGLTGVTHRVIAEGDLVVLHSTYQNAQAFGAEALVAFDVFRVEDGKVAEHWDNLQPNVPASESASGRSMVDGPTEIVDLEKTAENKALVQGFVDAVLLGAAPETITDFISTETYHQHNPHIADGLEGLGTAFAAFADQGLQVAYDQVHLVVAEGNFVFTAAEGTFGGQPTAFFDLFRVEAGKIVEHWDVVAAIPDEFAHENGKF